MLVYSQRGQQHSDDSRYDPPGPTPLGGGGPANTSFRPVPGRGGGFLKHPHGVLKKKHTPKSLELYFYLNFTLNKKVLSIIKIQILKISCGFDLRTMLKTLGFVNK